MRIRTAKRVLDILFFVAWKVFVHGYTLSAIEECMEADVRAFWVSCAVCDVLGNGGGKQCWDILHMFIPV